MHESAAPAIAQIASEPIQYLTFLLNQELYAVPVLGVQEICCWQQPTLLPECPDFIKGVINLRGTIVPIMDLRRRFFTAEPVYRDNTVVIILKTDNGQGGSRIMGVVVDAVSDVEDLYPEQLQVAPELEHQLESEFIDGLVDVDNKMLIILNIEALLAFELMFAEGART